MGVSWRPKSYLSPQDPVRLPGESGPLNLPGGGGTTSGNKGQRYTKGFSTAYVYQPGEFNVKPVSKISWAYAYQPGEFSTTPRLDITTLPGAVMEGPRFPQAIPRLGSTLGVDVPARARGAFMLVDAGIGGLAAWILWRAGRAETGFLSGAAYVLSVLSAVGAFASLLGGTAGITGLLDVD